MKIALYTRLDNPRLDYILETLSKFSRIEYEINPDSTDDFDIAISYGGDGTFLDSVRQMETKPIPIIGINSGRLGFLSTVNYKETEEALEHLLAGEYSIVWRSLIRVIADGILPDDLTSLALNEITIQKNGTTMVEVEVFIDGLDAGQYWADGVILSTPTGSTAYSMSVGGAIIAPNCRVLIVSPIAPHNLNVRPLVIDDCSEVMFRVQSRDGKPLLATVDNREHLIDSGSCLKLYRSTNELGIIKLRKENFYKTIREKLFWGVDPRYR